MVSTFADYQSRPICSLCGANFGLQVHHKRFRSQGGGDEETNLVRLCPVCHGAAHGLRLTVDSHSCATCPVLAREGCYFGERVLGRPEVTPKPWEEA